MIRRNLIIATVFSFAASPSCHYVGPHRHLSQRLTNLQDAPTNELGKRLLGQWAVESRQPRSHAPRQGAVRESPSSEQLLNPVGQVSDSRRIVPPGAVEAAAAEEGVDEIVFGQ